MQIDADLRQHTELINQITLTGTSNISSSKAGPKTTGSTQLTAELQHTEASIISFQHQPAFSGPETDAFHLSF
jgi:hypothetical protein